MAESRNLTVSVSVAGTWYRAGTASEDIPADDLAAITNPNVWDRPAPDTGAPASDDTDSARPAPRKAAGNKAR